MKRLSAHQMVASCLLLVILLSGAAACAPQPAAAPPALGTAMEVPAASTSTVSPAPISTRPPTATPTRLPVLTETLLRNAAYQPLDVETPEYSGLGLVQLWDGHFEARDPSALLPTYTVDYVRSAFGDLDGDGLDDAVVVLVASPGGSGSFYYLAPALNRDGRPENPSNTYMGDRVVIQALEIRDSRVFLEMLTQGLDDPMCCPSSLVASEYRLVGGRLLTSAQSAVAPLADQAIQALKNGDMASLAQLVHPQRGLRFSPYPYVSQDNLVFSVQQVAVLMDDPQDYLWGAFDGSGEPIQLAFPEFFKRFVYSQDFAGAQAVSFNHALGVGNSINNAAEFYPHAVIVEYYLPGSEQYAGMDWQSLRLVFQGWEGAWRLVGIIHAEWTI